MDAERGGVPVGDGQFRGSPYGTLILFHHCERGGHHEAEHIVEHIVELNRSGATRWSKGSFSFREDREVKSNL
jgi:hypothetical protein